MVSACTRGGKSASALGVVPRWGVYVRGAVLWWSVSVPEIVSRWGVYALGIELRRDVCVVIAESKSKSHSRD